MVKQEQESTPEAELAEFISDVEFSDLPERAIRIAERAFVDTVGVTLAGSNEGAGERAMEFAVHTTGKTSLFGQSGESSLLEAVFANATAGHALDFDDTALSATDGHPSVPMVAPLLAVGEQEQATGQELLTAYIAGFETQAYLNAPISPGHYERGWHATATLGTFGASAATASLLDLPVSEVRHALNIAASMPAGLKRNFGSLTKPVHAGHAARTGVSATRLAANGIDADGTAISGERGFFDLYSGETSPETSASHDLGEQWVILSDGIDIKKYACCYYTHAAIYGTVQLVDEHDIDDDALRQIQIEASRGAADAVEHDDPETPTQAKFSMPYLIAYALVNGTVDLDAFKTESLTDPTVETVRKKVTFRADDGRPYDSYGASISIETTSGTVYERTQDRPPGTHEDPLSDAELEAKFRMCADRVLSTETTNEVYDYLDSLRSVPDVSEITARL